MIAPMIDELAAENSGAVKIGKVNIDNNPAAAQAYDVISIPTLIVFQKGQVVDRFVGVQPKAKLQEALDAAK
jgi:thioredoxin 1